MDHAANESEKQSQLRPAPVNDEYSYTHARTNANANELHSQEALRFEVGVLTPFGRWVPPHKYIFRPFPLNFLPICGHDWRGGEDV